MWFSDSSLLIPTPVPASWSSKWVGRWQYGGGLMLAIESYGVLRYWSLSSVDYQRVPVFI